MSDYRLTAHTGFYNKNLKTVIQHVNDHLHIHRSPYFYNASHLLDVTVAPDNEILLNINNSRYTSDSCVLDKYTDPTSFLKWFASWIKKSFCYSCDNWTRWDRVYKSMRHGKYDSEYGDEPIDLFTEDDQELTLNDLIFVYIKFRNENVYTLTVPDVFKGEPLDLVTTEIIAAYQMHIKELQNFRDSKLRDLIKAKEDEINSVSKLYDKQYSELNNELTAQINEKKAEFEAEMKKLGLQSCVV